LRENPDIKMKFTVNHIKDFHFWKRINDYFDIGFLGGVVKFGDNYIGSVRNGYANLNDTVSIIKYDQNFNLISSEFVTKGEDPRTFIYKNIPYSICWSPDPATELLTYKLINLLSKEVIELSIEGVELTPLSTLGKNWIPLEKDDELYIVVSIEPVLNILKVNIKTGHCKWVEPSNFGGEIHVTQYRGGTPFIFNEKLNLYIGLGHKTYSSTYHTFFVYTLSKTLGDIKIHNEFYKDRINLVQDPMSIYENDGKIYFCVSNWSVPNNGFLSLYELIIN